MIRSSEIDSLLGLVGFHQPTLAGYDILDAQNSASSSGLWVDEISGLLTVKNIKATQEDPVISDADFNTYLRNRMKSSFRLLLNSICSDRDLVENHVLYPYENDWTHPLANATDFVGFEIDAAKTKKLSYVLNKIMLEFDGVGDVEILLFHSSQNAVQQSQIITTVANSAKHQSLNWDMPLFDGVTGGKWYIGYLRSGLTIHACNREFHSASYGNVYNLRYHDINRDRDFTTMDIRPVQIRGWDSKTLFDVNNVEYVSQTWGLNFDISVYKDFTSYVVENKQRFARPLQLQIAADLLTSIATSTRSNQDERMTKAEALFELNGNRNNPEIPQSVGILKQLDDEIKKLKKLFAQPTIQVNTLR